MNSEFNQANGNYTPPEACDENKENKKSKKVMYGVTAGVASLALAGVGFFWRQSYGRKAK